MLHIKVLSRFLFLFFVIFGLSFLSAKASETGYADTLLVVNDNSATSIAIGNYFLQARPTFSTSNVVHINADTSEWVSRTEYTNNIKTPIENYIQTHNLSSTTNYVILTKGVPIGITDSNNSVDSELAWCLSKALCAAGIGYGGLNPFYSSSQVFSHLVYNMYLVTRLDGYAPNGDISQIKNLIDHSALENIASEAVLKADGLFILDGGNFGWNGQLSAASTLLTSRGWRTILDLGNTYIRNKQNVLGYWSLGSNSSYIGASGQGSAPGNTYENGAIGETAVSTGARSFSYPPSYGQSLIADWIAEGISAMKGYAYEPVSSAVAHPDILFDHYTSGFNMADSYYAASEKTSWKDIVVGDPKMIITAPSNLSQIISFNISVSTSTINNTNHTISITVPYGSNITSLAPTISISTAASVSPASGTVIDFSNPVTYTVTAQDGTTTQSYVVTVTVAQNPAKTISTFYFNGLNPSVSGLVDEGNHTVTLGVQSGTDITALIPTITITGASIIPNSGVATDFTNPVTYTVTASDGTTQVYVVRVVSQVLATSMTISSDATSTWSSLGTVGFTGNYPDYTRISSTIYNGILYVAFSDANNADRATVMKYDGTNWTTVGSAGFSNSEAYKTSIYIYDGTPYISYSGGVMKYDGTNWVDVGSAGSLAPNETYTSISVYGGVPYVAYSDGSKDSRASVMKFDGTNWVNVGSSGFSQGGADNFSMYIYNGTPYVAYTDGFFDGGIVVSKFDGANWVDVGGSGFSQGTLGIYQQLSLFVYNGTPYLSYTDHSQSDKLKVMRYNGINWASVGDTDLYSPVYYISLNVYNGVPFVAFSRITGGSLKKANVIKYDGTNWVNVGATGFSQTGAYYTSLNVSNNTPYIAFEECSVDPCEITAMKAVSTISNGDTTQMSVIVSPSNTTNKGVTWSVTPGSGTATINPSSGLLTATGMGDITVTATANDGSGVQSSQKINILTGTSAKITSFNFSTATGTIDSVNHTISITVPYGTDVTSLISEISISAGASVSPNTGIVTDFTNLVRYTVTAQDGTTTQDYVATVAIAQKPAEHILTGYWGGGGSSYISPVLSTPLATTTSTSTMVVSTSTLTVVAPQNKNVVGSDDVNNFIDLLISLGIISPTNAGKAKSVISSIPVIERYLFTKDLYLGMTDQDVFQLQKFLNTHNFIISATGPGSPGNESKYFGIKTKVSLMKFQENNNIVPVSGYFGPKTRGSVNSAGNK